MIDSQTRLIAFQNLSREDKLLILNWRNHEEVKKWMYNSEIISVEKHLDFIESLKTSKDKKYFLVLNNENKIGVIYFTNIDKGNRSSELGLYSNPEIQGVGKLLIDIISKYAFEVMNCNRIFAEVFDSNKKAIGLYMNKNLTQYKIKIVDKRKIICMELINEDR